MLRRSAKDSRGWDEPGWPRDAGSSAMSTIMTRDRGQGSRASLPTAIDAWENENEDGDEDSNSDFSIVYPARRTI